MARRDAWRHKGRSILIVTLIGLPIFLLGAADITYRTWQLSPSEQLARAVGAADAGVRWEGAPIAQRPGGWLDQWAPTDPGKTYNWPTPSATDVRAAMPAGSRAIQEIEAPAALTFHTANGLDQTDLVGLDYTDPAAAGLVTQVSGRAPRTSSEVAITSALAGSVGLHVGQPLQLEDNSANPTIVGIVRDTSARDDQAVYSLPEAVPDLTANGSTATPSGVSQPEIVTWLIASSSPVTWALVRQLNTEGYLVLSRDAFLNPPAVSDIDPRVTTRSVGSNERAITVAALIVGMAILEVVLLAGPAFAVGARRRQHDLALISAVGGQRRDLRNTVLTSGVVLGLAGGLVGVLAAIGVTAAGIPLLASHVDTIPGAYHIQLADLLVLVLVGVGAAVGAAMLPARHAARIDVLAALFGRRGTTRAKWRVATVGLVVAILGAVIALVGGPNSTVFVVILVGVVLIEFGLIACTPALLGAATKIAGGLPTALRIAIRDAGRNRTAATPAVAAVMASVMAATAAILALAAIDQRGRDYYLPTLPPGTAYTAIHSPNVTGATAQQIADVEQAMRTTLPTSSVIPIHAISANISLVQPSTGQDLSATTESPPLARTLVDDGTDLVALFGQPEPSATAALQAGRVVVAAPDTVSDGTVTFDLINIGSSPGPSNSGPAVAATSRTPRRVTLPATAITPPNAATPVMILPPTVALSLGVTVNALGVLATTADTPTAHQEQAAQAALAATGLNLQLSIETGYHDSNAWLSLVAIIAASILAVAAAMISTGLTTIDAHADLMTLAAIGASPHTRRLLTMSRAGIVAGIGALIGIAGGLVAPAAWILAVHRQRWLDSPRIIGDGRILPPAVLNFVVPWATLIVLLLGIPAVAVLAAAATTGSTLPSETVRKMV